MNVRRHATQPLQVITTIFPTLNAGPTAKGFLANIGLTLGWTLLACIYLARVGEQSISADRDAVEQVDHVDRSSRLHRSRTRAW